MAIAKIALNLALIIILYFLLTAISSVLTQLAMNRTGQGLF